VAEPFDPTGGRVGLARRLASFGHSVRGIGVALRGEFHMQMHAVATVMVIGLGLYYQLARLEWALVALAVAGVWAAELFNTALEALTDLVSPGFHPLAGKAKDIAAGAVLLAALGAVAVGVLVFGPKMFA
jgi:diacylglycerol kinase (ATP)